MKETSAIVSHEPSQEGGGLFSIDPGLIIWTWVVFGLLLVILRKFAWKPMMESVEQRESMMTRAVEQAQKTKEELDRISRTQEEMLRQAKDEARKIIGDGRAAAEATARRIQEDAQVQAMKTIDEAREQLLREKELALREIREQSVDLIVAASGKLIEKSLDDETHRRIVEQHLEQW
ncbi:MAG: F0F1 ATP synthase subunit B [Chitinispirillaceae bacterium]|nr:F0F1 ATP synthase subunit B [Chitinispirillaceae bacterium]